MHGVCSNFQLWWHVMMVFKWTPCWWESTPQYFVLSHESFQKNSIFWELQCPPPAWGKSSSGELELFISSLRKLFFFCKSSVPNILQCASTCMRQVQPVALSWWLSSAPRFIKSWNENKIFDFTYISGIWTLQKARFHTHNPTDPKTLYRKRLHLLISSASTNV